MTLADRRALLVSILDGYHDARDHHEASKDPAYLGVMEDRVAEVRQAGFADAVVEYLSIYPRAYRPRAARGTA